MSPMVDTKIIINHMVNDCQRIYSENKRARLDSRALCSAHEVSQHGERAVSRTEGGSWCANARAPRAFYSSVLQRPLTAYFFGSRLLRLHRLSAAILSL